MILDMAAQFLSIQVALAALVHCLHLEMEEFFRLLSTQRLIQTQRFNQMTL